MLTFRFEPRVTEAAGEIWFTPGPPWQAETAQRIQAAFPEAFPARPGIGVPFLWLEENYLAVRGEALHDSEEPCGQRLARAVTLYGAIARPRAVASLSLHYQIQVPPEAVEGGRQVRSLVWQDRGEFLKMTLRPGSVKDAVPARLDIGYLLTRPGADCLRRPDRWLRGIHHRLDASFHSLRQDRAALGTRK